MRKLRERKAIQITRPGVEALVARGLLNSEASADPAEVREALVKLINATLVPPPAQPYCNKEG